MSLISRAFLYSLISLFIVISIGYYSYYSNYKKNLNIAEDVTFEIKSGDSEYTIFQNLHKQNIIKHPNLTYYTFRLRKKFNKELIFTSGEYRVTEGDNLNSLITNFVNNNIHYYKVTIAEGLTSSKIVELLNNTSELVGTLTTIPAEGSLFPSTYYYSKGNKKIDIITKMQYKMTDTLDQLWDKRDRSLKLHNKLDALTLASVIEKETGMSGERKKIASVFHNRLNKNIRLQSDPTVTYGITLGAYELGRPLSKRDLRTPTAYNTYTIYGLPLTPIANPGFAAIEAALSPDTTDYFYFVSNGYGVHQFSKTLKQHNKYVRELRKVEESQKQKNAEN